MFRIGMMVRKIRVLLKKPESTTSRPGIRGARSQQVGRYNSEQRAQFENIPSLTSQIKMEDPSAEWISTPG